MHQLLLAKPPGSGRPLKPINVAATATGSTTIEVGFDPGNAGIPIFVIYVYRSPDGSAWSLLTSAAPNSSPYVDSGLSGSTTYYYRVAARNANGLSVVSAAASATTDPNGMLQDTFTDTDGTDLSAHTLDLYITDPTWTILAGTWEIASNKAVRTSGASNEQAVVESGASDVTIQATLNTGDNSPSSYVGLVARASDANNMWVAIFHQVSGDPDVVELYEITSWTLRASGAFTAADSTDYVAKIVCSGNNIEVFIDGVSYCSYGSATYNNTGTKHGITMSAGSPATRTADDFTVTIP